VTLTNTFPDLLEDGRTNLLVFDVQFSCRNCTDMDLLLFTANPGNLSDVLEMPFPPFLTDKDDLEILAMQYDNSDIDCFCPANTEGTSFVKLPPPPPFSPPPPPDTPAQLTTRCIMNLTLRLAFSTIVMD